MIKKILTFWRKNHEDTSYKECEKLINSSLYTPMQPSSEFKAKLKARLAHAFSRDAHASSLPSSTSTHFLWKRLGAGALSFAVLVLAVIGIYKFSGQNLLDVQTVNAGQTAVPVNFPIKMNFPYDVSPEILTQYFVVEPATEGAVTLDKKILTFTSKRSLQYDTKYILRVKKEASPKMSEDFELKFDTRSRFATPLYAGRNLNFAHAAVGYYDATAQVPMNLDDGSYTATIHSIDAKELMKELTKKREENFKLAEYAKTLQKKNIVSTEKITVPRVEGDGKGGVSFQYKPKIDREKPGIYFVTLSDGGEGGPIHFFLSQSRFAISSMRIADDLAVWVVDQRSSQGVKDAKITIYQDEAKVVSTNTTNDTGMMRTTIPRSTEKTPRLMLIEKDGESVIAFVHFDYQYTIFDADWANPVKKYAGYLYTDRPLYTPGDTVNIKTILRKDNERTYKKNIKNVKIHVGMQYGQGGDPIFDKEIPVGDMGTANAQFRLPKDMKTGVYTVEAKIGDEHITSANFNVEVYQKPDIEIKVTPRQEKYLLGDEMIFDVSANYYFGQPVKNQEISVMIEGLVGAMPPYLTKLDDNGKAVAKHTVKPEEKEKSNQYSGYYGYSAGTAYRVSASLTNPTERQVEGTGIVTLFDSQYSAEISNIDDIYRNMKPREKRELKFHLKDNLTDGNAANTRLNVEIQEEGWDNKKFEHISNTLEKKSLTTDGEGNASWEYAFAKGGSYRILMTGKDSKGNEFTSSEYIWMADAQNSIYYDANKPGTEQIAVQTEKDTFKSGETAKIKIFTPQQEGGVQVTIYNNALQHMQSYTINQGMYELAIPVTPEMIPGIYIHAQSYNGDSFFTGKKFLEITGEKMKVTVTAHKKEYLPKDKITLDITTLDEDGKPVSAEVSVSVIDKALLALKQFDQWITIHDAFYQKPREDAFRRFSTTDAFAIGAAEKGGCFLAGTRILMADGTTKAIEDIRTGDKILTRLSDVSSILIEDTVVRTFAHNVNGYLVINGSLSVTDIHQILVNGVWKTAGEIKNGDVLIDQKGNRVYVNSIEKKAGRVPVYNFETELRHTYFANGIYVHNDKGGGPDTPRSEFVDSAYWNPVVKTDASGRATITFTLPDNLTTWAILSTGVTNDTKVGEGTSEFIVSKPLIARPLLPMFARAGDMLEVPVNVHNTTKNSMRTKVMLKASGATIADESIREINMAPESVTQLTWKLQINTVKQLKISASATQVDGKLNDTVELTIPIYSNLSLHKQEQGGSSPGQITFTLDPKSPEYDKAKLVVTGSMVASLPGIIEKLTGYPYGCVEQTMSKHLPNIFVKKYQSLLGVTPKPDLDETIKKGFERLAMFQHGDGGFGWWESDATNNWMTGYVTEGLIEIQDTGLLGGYEKMLGRSVEYLQKNYQSLSTAERIYFEYVLSRIPSTDMEKSVSVDFTSKDPLSAQSIAYRAMTLNNTNHKSSAKKLIEEDLLPRMKNNHWEVETDYNSMSDTYSTTGVALRALLEVGGSDQETMQGIVEWLMQNRNGYEGLWGSTRQSSEVLRALIKYAQRFDELAPNFTYTVELNGKVIDTQTVTDARFSKEIDLTNKIKGTVPQTLSITHTGEGTPLYTLTTRDYRELTAADRNLPIKITRIYKKADGSITMSPNSGDLITVELTVESDQDLRYVMLEDALAAGLQPVNDRLTKNNDCYDYCNDYNWYTNGPIDIRDNRVTLFFNQMKKGEKITVQYQARAVQRGTFSAPATRAEPMYNPLVYGLGNPEQITIK